jgi:hypothetical protein
VFGADYDSARQPEMKSGNETDSFYFLFADLRFVRFFRPEEIFVS